MSQNFGSDFSNIEKYTENKFQSTIPKEISIRSPPLIKAKIIRSKASPVLHSSNNQKSRHSTPRNYTNQSQSSITSKVNHTNHSSKVITSPKRKSNHDYNRNFSIGREAHSSSFEKSDNFEVVNALFNHETKSLIYNTSYASYQTFRRHNDQLNIANSSTFSMNASSLSPRTLKVNNLRSPPFIPHLSGLPTSPKSFGSLSAAYVGSSRSPKSSKITNDSIDKWRREVSPGPLASLARSPQEKSRTERKELRPWSQTRIVTSMHQSLEQTRPEEQSKLNGQLITPLKTAIDIDDCKSTTTNFIPNEVVQETARSAPSGQETKIVSSQIKERPSTSLPKKKSKPWQIKSVFSARRDKNNFNLSGSVSARFRKTQEAIENEYERVVEERARKKEHMMYIQTLFSNRRKKRQRNVNVVEEPTTEQFMSKEKIQQRLEREQDLIEKYREALSKHLGMHNFGWNKFESKMLLEEKVEEYDQWEKRNIDEFSALDIDNDGYVTHNDLWNNLRLSYSRMPQSEIDELLNYRPDVNTDVSLEEFLFIKYKKEIEIEELFNEIDINNDGRISTEEMQRWFNTQPELFEMNAEDIIFNHTNNFSGTMNLKEFKLLHGMGTKQDYASFEKTRELHLQLCEFFYGKYGRTDEEVDPEVSELISESDLKKKLFAKKKEKQYPQLFFKTPTRPSNSEIQSLKNEIIEEKPKVEEENSKIIKRLFKRRPGTANNVSQRSDISRSLIKRAPQTAR